MKTLLCGCIVLLVVLVVTTVHAQDETSPEPTTTSTSTTTTTTQKPSTTTTTMAPDEKKRLQEALNNGFMTLRNVNINTLLKKDKILMVFLKCLTDEGPCDQGGNALKELVPVSIDLECTICTGEDRASMIKLVKKVKYDFPYFYGRINDVFFNGTEPVEFEII